MKKNNPPPFPFHHHPILSNQNPVLEYKNLKQSKTSRKKTRFTVSRILNEIIFNTLAQY
jgi:hypothetical protein